MTRWPVTDRMGRQESNDFLRKASPIDSSDEIEMLTRALRGDLSPYSPQGVLTMSQRLAWLAKGEKP